MQFERMDSKLFDMYFNYFWLEEELKKSSFVVVLYR